MERLPALIVVVGLSVAIAEADEKLTPPWTPSTLTPEKDWRLAKQSGTQVQTIGLLSYYPNNGGGYTFVEGKQIAFYVFRNRPIVYDTDGGGVFQEKAKGPVVFGGGPTCFLVTIGPSVLPFGAQTIYRGEMIEIDKGVVRRSDLPIARWTRDSSQDNFRLAIGNVDNETRLKLKSIVPVLEHAEHGQ